MVSFSSIPASGWKLPLISIEVDGSQAGTPVSRLYALVTGYKLASGSAQSNVPVAVGSGAQAKALFGDGSMLERMLARFFTINRSQIVYALPIDSPGAGVAATGTITVSGAPTVAGTYSLYIAGQRVQVAIAAGTTAAAATAINAAINALTTLPVTAAVSTNVVTLTARHKGVSGNDIVVSDSYLGLNGGEVLPTGMAVTYAGMTGGTGVPDWTAAIASLGDEAYEYVAMPFTDTGSVSAWATEYGFSQSGRWGWMREVYGLVFSARRDTYAGHLTFGATNNSGVISIMAFETTVQSPPWECAAAYTAAAAAALTADPARPLQTLQLTGILPAPRQSRFIKTERNGIANAGLAIQNTVAGTVQIEREQTTYTLNSYGQPDNAFELITTLSTLATLFRRMLGAITSKYPRHKLANDGTLFGPGQAIVTPKIIKGEMVAQYRAAEYDGLVENTDTFKKFLIVERDPNDSSRVNVLYPPDVINGMRFFAVLAQFRLQYTAADLAA
jgi:phage tail sheath gpL-like